ncbi:TetR family transcriptional regulator [Gordonia amarae]|uniref:TetR family transcriptional regulator n=1 Tax=Gordonia amarae TaxID=36821 RepID=A0A857MH42_9ACTN|nr:TetR family transcriptional regulator [Gordonia amarae]QHN24202.1 TetR family transcriptional regulator [Gordonia amarae]QHN33118.1 TetR family transcriptional regulator [Gordonia amarae]QHN41843.1 TetR family transcriptional regulator [Gordonia amarae]
MVTGAPEPAARRPTRRDQAKAARRAELLEAAARQMAERGFAAVRLEDIGAAVGISGPGMYRHFSSKSELLDELLVDISRRLHDGGAQVVETDGGAAADPAATLRALIRFHIDVLVTKPDLISVQDRDLSSLSPAANHEVRSLQRRYVERWVDVLVRVDGPDGDGQDGAPWRERGQARVRVHAVFGLLNSSPRLPDYPRARLRGLLASMAWAALLAPAEEAR